MKPVLIAAAAMLVLASCDVLVVEPAYDYRDDVVGYYDIEEYSDVYNDYVYYDIYIGERSGSRRAVYISNFYGADITIDAYLDNRTITIPYQVVNGYEVEGSGYFSGSRLTLDFSVKDRYDHTRRDYCTARGDLHW